jgi:hypothetical protein
MTTEAKKDALLGFSVLVFFIGLIAPPATTVRVLFKYTVFPAGFALLVGYCATAIADGGRRGIAALRTFFSRSSKI